MQKHLFALTLFAACAVAPAAIDGGESGSTDAGNDGGTDAGGLLGDAGGARDAAVERWSPDGGLVYRGAFRFEPIDGLDYAVGTLAINPVKHSLFVVGFQPESPVAEFAIPDPAMDASVKQLPTGRSLQAFSRPLRRVSNPQGLDIITGMLWQDGQLLVNAEIYYDAPGTATDTTFVFRDADHLADGGIDGLFKLQGGARAAGYLGLLPAPWNTKFGATHYVGWASNYAIVSRYSVGPSFHTFDPAQVLQGPTPTIDSHAWLVYPYGGAHYLDPSAVTFSQQPASPLWNIIARGVYGFVVPGTRTFAVVGSTGGTRSGIGYKITQTNGHVCGGPCPYDPSDITNQIWLWDLQEILEASEPWATKPYAYGPLALPFDAQGLHNIVGATFDSSSSTLYIALGNGAGRIGDFDAPPVVLVYQVK